MKYPKFKDAVENLDNLINLIPCKFVLSDEDEKQMTIHSSGLDASADGNERMENYKSSTIDPRSYLFKHGNTEIRLIDTPGKDFSRKLFLPVLNILKKTGIVDTEGMDEDKKNLDKVLRYLPMIEEVQGIIILINTMDNKLDVTFKYADIKRIIKKCFINPFPFLRYCITELLTQLHRDACKNIVFCFTFSRNSHYKPGDAFYMLKQFLSDELKVNLKLKSKVNCFFIDNEAYRFLLAKKCNYSFPPEEVSDYKNSWKRSVEQTNLMLNVIAGLDAHDLDKTISLNNSRDFIYQMAEPIVDLNTLLEANIAHIENQERELQDVTKNKLELARNLNIVVDDIDTENLPYPTTVCISEKCIDYVVDEKGQKLEHFKTRCHENCQLKVDTNVTG